MKQTITRLLDDLDGGDAHETVQFGYAGTTYTIDLSTEHAAHLRDILAPYTAAGTRNGRAQARISRRGSTTLNSPRARAEIRAWARKNGWPDIAGRGRIPDDVYEMYAAARRGYSR